MHNDDPSLEPAPAQAQDQEAPSSPRRSVPPIEDPLFEGTLFTTNFIDKKIKNESVWQDFDKLSAASGETLFQEKYAAFKKLALYEKIRAETDQPPSDETGSHANEANTKTDIIKPVLEWLGWHDGLGEIELPTHMGGRPRPDELHFASKEAKHKAELNRDYAEVLCVMEYKRWDFPLDIFKRKPKPAPGGSSGGSPGGSEVPDDSHAQILWYLKVLSHPPYDRGGVSGSRGRWGLLTNGVVWRLYFSGAPSIASSYFGLDFRTLFDPSKCSPERLEHYLRCFFLLFARSSFVTSLLEAYHDKCLKYETGVTLDLSDRVLEKVFPDLLKAFGRAWQKLQKPELGPEPEPSLEDLAIMRRGALILLYRLLFLLYAEDRALLPINHTAYRRDSFRHSVREPVREVLYSGQLSYLDSRYVLWETIKSLFCSIDKGESEWNLPPYNGGLFEYTPLLDDEGFKLSDRKIYDLTRHLSFEYRGKSETKSPSLPGVDRYINYRDLGVQQLGTLYEQLLDRKISWRNGEVHLETQEPKHKTETSSHKKDGTRKEGGIYYTEPALVQLLVRETLDPLLKSCENLVKTTQKPTDKELDRIAKNVLDLKICDPAMGSGHFLVEVVDYLSDRILEFLARIDPKSNYGAAGSDGLVAAIETMRQEIKERFKKDKLEIDDNHLIDRHLVRRMVLKRCVYGVDKNEMAVELTKLSLWLHTFTVGVPLSFLDHHLRHGDSLFGLRPEPQGPDGKDDGSPRLPWLEERRNLFTHDLETNLGKALVYMRNIETEPDTDLKAVRRSKENFEAYQKNVLPLRRMFNVFYSLDWYKYDKLEKPEKSEDGGAGVAPKKSRLIREFWPLARLLDDVLDEARSEGDAQKLSSAFFTTCKTIRDDDLPEKSSDLLKDFFELPSKNSLAILAVLTDDSISGLKRASTEQASEESPPPAVWTALESLDPPPLPDAFESFQKVLAAEDAAALRPALEGVYQKLRIDLLWKLLILALQENFLHWEIEFLSVWPIPEQSSNTDPGPSVRTEEGFDAIVSNPPWEGVKLQKPEWVSRHDDPDLEAAYKRAQINNQRKRTYASKSGAYPVMGSGNLNYYRLFVERAESLLNERGRVGMLMPSGIATDKTNAAFFAHLIQEKRLCCFYDFENKKVFFPDVDSRFRFCALVWQKEPWARDVDYAVMLHKTEELEKPDRRVTIRHEDLALFNPNTKTAPMFVSRRDKELVLALYKAAHKTGHPILRLIKDTSPNTQQDTPQNTPTEWRIKYTNLFHQTNDKRLFRRQAQLEKHRAWKPHGVDGRIYKIKNGLYMPLYQARMIELYDHRFNSIGVNTENPLKTYVNEGDGFTQEQKSRPHFLPTTHHWITQRRLERKLATVVANWKKETDRNKETQPDTTKPETPETPAAPPQATPLPGPMSSSFESASLARTLRPYFIAYRNITNATNTRTLLASFLPLYGAGNSLGVFLLEKNTSIRHYMCLLANMNALAMDFVARNKIQGTNLNLFIFEQLPFLPSTRYDEVKIGGVPVGDLIASMVFELTYTAWDLAPLAQDFLTEGGQILEDAPPPPPPIFSKVPLELPKPWSWNADRRRTLEARLNALFFLLYDITDRDDVRYVYESFPILRREAKKDPLGEPDPLDLCLNYLNAYLGGEPTP